MKLMVCAVLLLICMQSIGANKDKNDCEKDLKAFRKEMCKFFKQFQKDHDVSKVQLQKILTLCKEIRDAYDAASGCSSKDINCKLAALVNTLFDRRMEVLHTLMPFMYQSYLLLDHADAIQCDWDLICNSAAQKCSCACEAETNKLSCELVAFFKDIATHGVNVKGLILNLLGVCDKIYELTRSFDCKYGPNCNDGGCACEHKCSCGAVRDEIPSAAIHDFLKDFGKYLGQAETIVAAIEKICDSVSNGIDAILASECNEKDC